MLFAPHRLLKVIQLGHRSVNHETVHTWAHIKAGRELRCWERDFNDSLKLAFLHLETFNNQELMVSQHCNHVWVFWQLHLYDEISYVVRCSLLRLDVDNLYIGWRANPNCYVVIEVSRFQVAAELYRPRLACVQRMQSNLLVLLGCKQIFAAKCQFCICEQVSLRAKTRNLCKFCTP